MSCIIEGSLEILRPVAAVERNGDDWRVDCAVDSIM